MNVVTSLAMTSRKHLQSHLISPVRQFLAHFSIQKNFSSSGLSCMTPLLQILHFYWYSIGLWSRLWNVLCLNHALVDRLMFLKFLPFLKTVDLYLKDGYPDFISVHQFISSSVRYHGETRPRIVCMGGYQDGSHFFLRRTLLKLSFRPTRWVRRLMVLWMDGSKTEPFGSVSRREKEGVMPESPLKPQS